MTTTVTPQKALIVDDEMTNRLILRSLLKKEGFETIEAVDGKQAVEAYKQDHPDIIFMDVMMPVMDGYEATREIKSLTGNRFVPIIFLTAMTDQESLSACIEAGGDDFLTKPYDKFLLQTKIRAMQRIAGLNKEVQGMYSLMHREQEIAETVFSKAVQSSNIDNPNIRTMIRPAETFSGDMILSAYAPSRNLHLLLGDFTGHGLSSALGALPVSEVFNAMTKKGFDIEAILLALNNKLKSLLPVGMFLGVQLISISHDLEHVKVLNAGMQDLFIIDGQTNEIRYRAKSRGLPLGVIDKIDPKEIIEFFPISNNDKLLLFSDGLTEARNSADEEYGLERLENTITSAEKNGVFDSIITSMEAFGAQTKQADDISLVEVNCIQDLLPELEINEDIKPTLHHFEDKGEWQIVIQFFGSRLQKTNPVPILINHIMELEGLESERQSLFTVLTELFVNALDHGVLDLNSSLKSDPAGFAKYFEERGKRLNQLQSGFVTFNLSVEQEGNIRSIAINVQDSGKGFDYDKKPVTSNDELALSGRGMTLIESLCESLTYLGNGNTVEAIYSWKTS